MSQQPTQSSLHGKRALVTGASGGIGCEIARALDRCGVSVCLTGRKIDVLDRLAAELDNPAMTASVDLQDENALLALAARVRDELGEIDVLVNCAGMLPVKPLIETTTAEFDACLSVNLRAPFILCREFASGMQQRRWGRIVNIASSSAYSGFANSSVYCASKHGLLGLSRSLFNEMKNDNVRTFCISPGSVRTEMGRQIKHQDPDTFIDPQEMGKFVVDTIAYDGHMIAEEVRLNRMFVQ
jgi:NAD(P)-dependent dehydrogenase (short-subunit alcohol dehydrogenase family)